MLKDSRNIDVGSRLDITGDFDHRGVIVVGNDDNGLSVIWYTPDGVGPHYATLPHAKLHQTRYHDERGGEHQSFWDTHPDFTGAYGDV